MLIELTEFQRDYLVDLLEGDLEIVNDNLRDAKHDTSANHDDVEMFEAEIATINEIRAALFAKPA